MTSSNLRWIALGAGLVVVAAAIFLVGMRIGKNEAATGASPPPGLATPTGTGSSAFGTTTSTTRAELSVNGRGIDTDAPIGGLRTVHLAGAATVRIPGRPSGSASTGEGLVFVTGDDISITARDISLDSGVLVGPKGASIHAGEFGGHIRVSGPATVSGAKISAGFNGADTTPSSPFSFVAGSTVPNDDGEIRSNTPNVTWTNAPATLRLSGTARTWTSWAGSGSVRIGGTTLANDHGALAAKTIDGTIERTAGHVRASAKAVVQQVYLDGVPHFATRATCDYIQIKEESAAGRRIELTWAPRNIGDFDMVMTRLRPVGPAASWMSFGLASPPHTFGGEERPPRPGDTSGFGTGSPIRSVLPPGDADRRDIGVNIPAGTKPGTYDASVEIDGNFAPITVPFQVIVA